MRKFVIGLFLLVVVACRSLPQDVADAHATSQDESTAIVSIWEEQLVPSANGNSDVVTDVNELAMEYSEHVHKLIVARDIVKTYLESANGDPDAALGFNTATELLLDIDLNIQLVLNNWEAWRDPESDTSQFIKDVNEMIVNFKTLDRKFNEWVKQFKVK